MNNLNEASFHIHRHKTVHFVTRRIPLIIYEVRTTKDYFAARVARPLVVSELIQATFKSFSLVYHSGKRKIQKDTIQR